MDRKATCVPVRCANGFVPDWVPSEPTFGKWVFREIDGKRKLVNVHESSEKQHFHYIIQDSMNPTENPADGRTYDSRSKFHEATKAAGCVWVGNIETKSQELKPIGLKQEIIRQVEEWKSPDKRKEHQNRLQQFRLTGEMPE